MWFPVGRFDFKEKQYCSQRDTKYQKDISVVGGQRVVLTGGKPSDLEFLYLLRQSLNKLTHSCDLQYSSGKSVKCITQYFQHPTPHEIFRLPHNAMRHSGYFPNLSKKQHNHQRFKGILIQSKLSMQQIGILVLYNKYGQLFLSLASPLQRTFKFGG